MSIHTDSPYEAPSPVHPADDLRCDRCGVPLDPEDESFHIADFKLHRCGRCDQSDSDVIAYQAESYARAECKITALRSVIEQECTTTF